MKISGAFIGLSRPWSIFPVPPSLVRTPGSLAVPAREASSDVDPAPDLPLIEETAGQPTESRPQPENSPDPDFFSIQAVINDPIPASMEKRNVNYAELQYRLQQVKGPRREKAVLQQRAAALAELQDLLHAHAHPQTVLADYRKKYANPGMDALRCQDHIKREIHNFRQAPRLTPDQQNYLIHSLTSH